MRPQIVFGLFESNDDPLQFQLSGVSITDQMKFRSSARILPVPFTRTPFSSVQVVDSHTAGEPMRGRSLPEEPARGTPEQDAAKGHLEDFWWTRAQSAWAAQSLSQVHGEPLLVEGCLPKWLWSLL